MHGYDASQAAAFFTSLRRLSDQAGGSLPNHLSSHPDPGDRERSMHELSNIWRERGFPQTIINDEQYLSRINGITIGENPREGFVENDVFYHPDLEFLFPIPTSWRTMNTPTQVAIFNAEQSAISIFNIAQGAENARSAVEAFTNQEGVTVVNSSRFNINNLPGHRAIARARDSKGTDLRIMVQAIEYGGLVYRFLSYSTDQSFNSFEPAFNFMVTGFNRLTDRSKLDIEPVRIEVITANRTGTFESFLPSPIPMGMSAETIAIKNQLSLTDVITRGQKLKLPVQQ
jgi:predicted Zn-dependent protease